MLDEAHKSPNVLGAVKEAVDKKWKTRRFVLSGSTNLLLMKSVSEILAGRAVYYALSSMTVGEMREKSPPDLHLPVPHYPRGRNSYSVIAQAKAISSANQAILVSLRCEP